MKNLFAASIADACIVHDGTNTPLRVYDLDTLIPSSAALSNAPVFYGQPVPYYAKLFAIKAAERNVIVWSEENDPTIGYESTPYSNSWEIGQTDQAPLYALAATNEPGAHAQEFVQALWDAGPQFGNYR